MYVGGFELPDRNAAAQRVLSNALAFRECGLETIFVNFTADPEAPTELDIRGFRVLNRPRSAWVAEGLTGSSAVAAMASAPDLWGVVAYNYPAPGLARILSACRRRGVPVIGDITERYIYRGPRALEAALRMGPLNRAMDGLLVISRRLQDDYAGCANVLRLPPLVDADDSKWVVGGQNSQSTVRRLVYAGSPSRSKERLDLIVAAVSELGEGVGLVVVGVTAEQYRAMYGVYTPLPSNIRFEGRLPHAEALTLVGCSDWSVLVRDSTRATEAGFPTKFAESVTLGVPVACNDVSDVACYCGEGACGVVVEKDRLTEGFASLLKVRRPCPDRKTFDYRRHVDGVRSFLELAEKKTGM